MLLPGLGAPGGTGAAITESNQIKSKLVPLPQITKQTPEEKNRSKSVIRSLESAKFGTKIEVRSEKRGFRDWEMEPAPLFLWACVTV